MKQEIRKPTRNLEENTDDITEFWDEWTMTSQWQENILQLLQLNEKNNIFDISGISEVPKDCNPITFQKELSLFTLLFLYCEIPYQMGIYHVSCYNKKTKKHEDDYDSRDISGVLKDENLFFSKMNSDYGLRNFVMKYLEFCFYILTLVFKSNYQKYKLIYSLMKKIFSKESPYFNKMFGIYQDDIRNYLKGVEDKYLYCADTEIIYKMSLGTGFWIDSIIEDQRYPESASELQTLPIYPYVKELVSLGGMLYKFSNFHSHIDYFSQHSSWLECDKEHVPFRYLT